MLWFLDENNKAWPATTGAVACDLEVPNGITDNGFWCVAIGDAALFSSLDADEAAAVLRGCQDRGWLGPAGEITPEGRFVLDMAVSRGRLRRVEMVVWDDAPWWGPAPLREPRPRTGRFQVRLVEVRLSTLRRLTTRSSCWCCALRLAGR